MEEQRRMPSGINGVGWAAIGVSLLLSAITGINAFAVQGANITQNAKDIAEMKQAGRDSANTLSEIDRRTARMETKLEILLPTATVKELEARR